MREQYKKEKDMEFREELTQGRRKQPERTEAKE